MSNIANGAYICYNKDIKGGQTYENTCYKRIFPEGGGGNHRLNEPWLRFLGILFPFDFASKIYRIFNRKNVFKILTPYNGFTLAEVLITLGIIGIVAAMTLPALVQKYRKTIVENQLKQAYSLISNAVKWAEVENGIGFEITTKNFDDVNNVNGFSYEHSEAVFEKYFKKHFKITQSYNKTDSQKYFKYRGQTTRTYISPGYAKCYKLTNGQGLCYIARGGDQMGYFYIYLKPDKQDKVIGRDVFSLEFTRKNNVFKVYQLIQDSYKESKRTQYINGCISENEYPIGSLPRVMICTFLIWNNNFKIPKDYPIIF